MAATMSPLVTFKHEHIVAVSGKASTPNVGFSPELGKINPSGFSGNSMPFKAYCSNESYSLVSPTKTAPINSLPFGLTTIFL